MPFFPDAESLVAYQVFKQTRTEGDVTTYEIVDRFIQDPGSKIVARFDDETEANAYRDQLRAQRVIELPPPTVMMRTA